MLFVESFDKRQPSNNWLRTIFCPRKGNLFGLRFHRRIQTLIVITVLEKVLGPISIGKLYHWIRGQTIIRLYVLIAIVEVFV
mmetsp:Transcript_17396/g.31396  ORF Transcript_17396/g.31396 Transcript_17396/m.31396 type:complete len:82 (-) Transcript_17396:171-416(-)